MRNEDVYVLISLRLALKNQLESTGNGYWTHLVELVVNANTTALFTTSPETVTHNGSTYAPVLMSIGQEEQSADGELPRMTIDVWNYRGQVFRFAKDNDLSLNDVTIRLVHTSLTNSGAEDILRMQILGAAFVDEIGRFTLGYRFNYDAEGPSVVYDRTTFPSIPFNFRNYAII